ncbi:MAG: MBL fold metallo-hydrolase [Clostridia bacterium]|nr:MBL fold metallo-hydrolase [Clostridia bacterium]
MKIHILGASGACAPHKNFHQCSFAVEVDNDLYFIDCGENCGHSAHIKNLSILNTKAIIITHAHSDHFIGLPGLLWTMKFVGKYSNSEISKTQIIASNPQVFNTSVALLQIAMGADSDFLKKFSFKALTDGEFFEDNNLSFSAVGNNHMKYIDQKPQSFSLMLNYGKTKIFISSDINKMDLENVLSNECDALFLENAHTDICELQNLVNLNKCNAKHIYLFHHSQDVLDNFDAFKSDIKGKFKNFVTVCDETDNCTFEF